MSEAAAAFLNSLDDDQRAKATFNFPADDERRLWFYTPTDHGGLPLAEMRPAQQQRALRLVAAGLSAPGFTVASTIIGLENTLDALEGWRSSFYTDRGPDSRSRDPQLYSLSIFGEPVSAGGWGWRFGGHHISLNYTIVDGAIVAPTPTFFGAHPAETPFVGPGLLRPLAGEEDLGRELLHSLTPEQRGVALLSPVAPWDIAASNRSYAFEAELPRANWEIFRGQSQQGEALQRSRRNQERIDAALGVRPEHLDAIRLQRTPRGIAASALTPGQRQILVALTRQYIDRMPDELGEAEYRRVSGVLDSVHFAWAGGAERRQPHYYRLQGERFLVEYDNTQNDVNHIHAVWRDPDGDFGADLLGQHLAAAHR